MSRSGLEDSACREVVSFLGRPLPRGFAMRVVVVAAGARRAYDADEWRDAVVVVEFGEIVLEPVAGRAYRFERGDVLWLDRLALVALHNPADEPAVLAAVSRRGRRTGG
jgi:hypothetical protein